MISTATASTRRVGEARRRTPDRPGDEGDDRNRDHQRARNSRKPVGQALNRGAAALRLGDHCDDLREHRVAADLSARITKPPALVHRAADHRVAGALVDGHRFAGDHGFVDGAAPSITSPSTGIFSPGRTRRRSPSRIASRATSSSAPSARIGARFSARDRAARGSRRRSAARAQLQHLPEQDERR